MAEVGEMTCTNAQGLAVPGLVFVAREERSEGGEGADTLERFCERNAGLIGESVDAGESGCSWLGVID